MKRIFCSILLITISVSVFGQDNHFTQFNNTPMMINPALTGAFRANNRVIATYRGQWKSFTKAYMTFGVSYELSFLKKRLKTSFLSLGIQFLNDQSGDINLGQTQILVSAAYHLGVNPHNMIVAGLQGGWGQRRLLADKMIFGSQYDPNYPDGFNPSLPTNETMPFVNIDYGDFSAGLLWHYNSKKSTVNTPETKKFTMGMAVFHINRPKQTFSNLLTDRAYMKFVFHAHSSIGFKNSIFSIQPSAFCAFQGPTSDIVFGNLFCFRLNTISYYTNYNPETFLALGAYYRVNDAIIAMVQLDWKSFLLGLSYDINISKLSNASNSAGGFEATLRYMFPIATAGDKNLY